MDDKSDGPRRALENYYRKLLPKEPRPKNKRPEKDVEHECLLWMRAQGWNVQIYEAKAIYNPKTRRYISASMKAGTVDCQGVLPGGTFVAVEFKAPGRISSFNASKNFRQKQYLIEKITYGAFGAVVDSASRLEQIYKTWRDLKTAAEKKSYLISVLP